MTEPAAKASGHMPQLDGLRAFAAMAVLLFHYLGHKHAFNQLAPWGTLGVNLFYVLSGFLITGILLRCKAQVESGQATAKRELGVFYLRRGVRIFPVYYLTLGVAYFLGLPAVRDSIAWHLGYASNFYFTSRGGPEGPASHLWSLSVEEQFYLVWPCLILFTPRRHLETLLVGAVVLAPLSRLAYWFATDGAGFGGLLPNACLDTLGIGALLALYGDAQSGDTAKRTRLMRVGFWVGVPGLLIYCIGQQVARRFDMTEVLGPALAFSLSTISGLLFVWVVARCARAESGGFGRVVLCNPALMYLGKISYGLYLFHNFVPSAWKAFHEWSGHGIDLTGSKKVLVFIALSIALASLSWHLFERPLNNLKRYFEYEKPASALSSKPIVSGNPGNV